MERFIQQQIEPMTERSVPKAPCPFCPAKAVSFLSKDGGKKKEKKKKGISHSDVT